MTTNNNSGVPGTNTPKKKAPDACNTEGLVSDTNDLDFATGTRSSKDLANQIAVLALAGHVVIRGDCGDFTVCKYGLSRYCADFAELQDFARRLGVDRD
jgi:hypothetical protein